MNPGIVLAVLLVLIGAQTTCVVAPQRLRYLWALALAAAGLVAAELIAVALHAGGPRLGMLHPAADALGVAGFELVGTLLTPSRRGSP